MFSVGSRYMETIKKDIKDKEINRGVISKKGKNNIHETSSSNERQSRIIAALRGKGWLPVTEVAALCGEGSSTKTIQRDLALLMQNGIIQSKGERRWRIYALAASHHESNE